MYRVIKTIKGRKYLYAQSSWREGTRVRTKCRSLGPASAADLVQVRREQALRKAGPSRGSVRALLKELTDPGRADLDWKKPWDLKQPPRDRINRVPELDRLVLASGASIRPHVDAAYSWTRDVVLLPPARSFHDQGQHQADAMFYATAIHELAHWSGHQTRLNRNFPEASDPDYWQLYVQEELIAETTTVMVLRHMGQDPISLGRHAFYIQYYLNECQNKASAMAIAEIEAHRASCFILSRVNTTLDARDKVSS